MDGTVDFVHNKVNYRPHDCRCFAPLCARYYAATIISVLRRTSKRFWRISTRITTSNT
jgi:hypothetical protein